MLKKIMKLALLVFVAFLWACEGEIVTDSAESDINESVIMGDLDAELALAIEENGLGPLDPIKNPGDDLVHLGQVLFFDKELSGNRNISCATCHHPKHASVDALSLAIGTGGNGLGPNRQKSSGSFIARNSQDLFNRGYAEVVTMFTDMRVSGNPITGFTSPAGDQLPQGLNHVLAAQALFPIQDRLEMRGKKGDLDVFGRPNELAEFGNNDFIGFWNALVKRITSIEGYQELLSKAYPFIPLEEIKITHLVNAIAAFESFKFNFIESPWDLYLAGDQSAMSDQEKRGALLFYGKANCVQCHPGKLLFDQDIDNVLVPNLGPGKPGAAPLDTGVALVSGSEEDRFAFRSTPLRNVELTGPYMHNGSFTSLEQIVRHYNDITNSFLNMDFSGLQTRFKEMLIYDIATQSYILQTMSGDTPPLDLDEAEIQDLVAFLKALTDPAARDMSSLIPSSVPSGLKVEQ